MFYGAFVMKAREKSFIRINFFICLLMIVSESSMIRAQSDPSSRVIEGAKKEGALVWYTALNLNDSEMLTKRFEQLYPFIKTETLRLSSFSLLSKIQTEARAGAFKADVIEIAGVLGHILKRDGLFSKYVSPESRFYPD
jgi:iron(III) transport system substrate-binding protein